MIREIGIELLAELKTKGVPFPVVDGPEPTVTTTWGRERIVIEYDSDGSDAFVPPVSQSKNPKNRFVSNEACKVTIYAQTARAGATVAEHRRRAKTARDCVVVALEQIAADRKNRVAFTGGRFITPKDLEGAPIPGGAVYELTFAWARSIPDLAWSGDAQPEGEITAIGSTTVVRTRDDDAGATACGA